MEESMLKRVWNHSITIGQLLITAVAMAIITGIACAIFLLFKPSKN